jgi:hypothetical protein
MRLSDRQIAIRDRIAKEMRTCGVSEIIYYSQWLGYLPFGVYHWIECNHNDFTKDFPSGWERNDLDALEEYGFLESVDEWQDPEDTYNYTATYHVKKDL